jgi:hypothetical protein
MVANPEASRNCGDAGVSAGRMQALEYKGLPKREESIEQRFPLHLYQACGTDEPGTIIGSSPNGRFFGNENRHIIRRPFTSG